MDEVYVPAAQPFICSDADGAGDAGYECSGGMGNVHQCNKALTWTSGGGDGDSNVGSSGKFGSYAGPTDFVPVEDFADSFDDEVECIRVANQLIMKTLENQKEDEQTRLGNKILNLRPFGLRLNLTWCAKLCASEVKTDLRLPNRVKDEDLGRMKACNFTASVLKIGAWERVSRNEGDLVAKCYFAKRKLVWEILEQRLKRKIEVQWTNIIAIQCKIEDNEPAVLQIELNERPTFFVEVDPQPRKHTIWNSTSDFTGGQANKFRKHYLMFPPGSLDKHYEKLMQYDDRLLELSKKGFPSMPWSPTFPEENGRTEATFHHNPFILNIVNSNRGMHPTVTEPMLLRRQCQSCDGICHLTSPVSVADFEHSNGQFSDNARLWNQGVCYYGDALANDQTGNLAADVLSTQLNSTLPCHQANPDFSWHPCPQLDPAFCQPYNLSTYGQGVVRDEASYNLTSHFLIGNCNGSNQVPGPDSRGVILNLPEENTNPVQYQDINDYVHINGVGGQFHQQEVAESSMENTLAHFPPNVPFISLDQFHQQQASSNIIQVSSTNSRVYENCNNTDNSMNMIIGAPYASEMNGSQSYNQYNNGTPR